MPGARCARCASWKVNWMMPSRRHIIAQVLPSTSTDSVHCSHQRKGPSKKSKGELLIKNQNWWFYCLETDIVPLLIWPKHEEESTKSSNLQLVLPTAPCPAWQSGSRSRLKSKSVIKHQITWTLFWCLHNSTQTLQQGLQPSRYFLQHFTGSRVLYAQKATFYLPWSDQWSAQQVPLRWSAKGSPQTCIDRRKSCFYHTQIGRDIERKRWMHG